MPNSLRALTIRQPWAGAIAHQTKRVENRSWKLPAKYEGARILIHAGAQLDPAARVYGPNLGVYGAVVAVATLSGSHWSDDGTCCGPWGFAQSYHWTLADVVALDEPVPAKGRLGIWAPDGELVASVTEQIKEGNHA
ncbi:hypothetical protein HZZ00_37855 (plasmid) [Streptomyces sp. NEAU-sy36]|uniref:hypothetical protein n=1 Tax=unclassified Streptomyces TaxID=2593676 RepID=UPI0015D5C36E|nr:MULTISPECIES: hypothetical protein [unclassified Streptomyces]QLJ06797.1 hypothetical protein HZZ00_37855 [Streptomyces sp. NEAU-sy36]